MVSSRLENLLQWKGTLINQRKNILDISIKMGLTACKPVAIPMHIDLKLCKDVMELLEDQYVYQRIIGSLLYLTLTRPDISFVVHLLSQFLSFLRTVCLSVVVHLLRYLQGICSLGLFYSSLNTLHTGLFYSSENFALGPKRKKVRRGFSFIKMQGWVLISLFSVPTQTPTPTPRAPTTQASLIFSVLQFTI